MSVGGAGGAWVTNIKLQSVFPLLQRSGWNVAAFLQRPWSGCHRFPSAPELVAAHSLSLRHPRSHLWPIWRQEVGLPGLGVGSLGQEAALSWTGHPLTLALMQPAFCSSSTLSLPPVLGEYCSAFAAATLDGRLRSLDRFLVRTPLPSRGRPYPPAPVSWWDCTTSELLRRWGQGSCPGDLKVRPCCSRLFLLLKASWRDKIFQLQAGLLNSNSR